MPGNDLESGSDDALAADVQRDHAGDGSTDDRADTGAEGALPTAAETQSEAVAATSSDTSDTVEALIDGWKKHFTPEEQQTLVELRAQFETGYDKGPYGGINESAATAIRQAFRMLVHKGVTLDWMEDVLGKKMGILRVRLEKFNGRLPDEKKISLANEHEQEKLPAVRERVRGILERTNKVTHDDDRRTIELWVRLQRCVDQAQDIAGSLRQEMNLPIYRTNKIGEALLGVPTDELWPEELKPKEAAIVTPADAPVPNAARAVADDPVAQRFEEPVTMLDHAYALLDSLTEYDTQGVDDTEREILGGVRSRLDALLGTSMPSALPPVPLDPNKILRVEMGDRSMVIPEEIIKRGGKITVTELEIAPPQPE